jgi:hypothetical protein
MSNSPVGLQGEIDSECNHDFGLIDQDSFMHRNQMDECDFDGLDDLSVCESIIIEDEKHQQIEFIPSELKNFFGFCLKRLTVHDGLILNELE